MSSIFQRQPRVAAKVLFASIGLIGRRNPPKVDPSMGRASVVRLAGGCSAGAVCAEPVAATSAVESEAARSGASWGRSRTPDTAAE